jgi:uncharacterized membrane protein YbhN (UPF0104 family)
MVEKESSLGNVKNSQRFPWLVLIKIVIGIGLLIISFWRVEWEQFGESLRKINLAWLLAVILVVVLSLLLKILRAHIFLKNFGLQVPFMRVLEAFYLGQAVNILLPSRGGDLVRIGYLCVKRSSDLPQITVAIALEKFLDLIAMAVIALSVAAYLPTERASWVRGWLFPVSILAAVALIIVLVWGPILWSKVRYRVLDWSHPRVQNGVQMIDKLVESSLWLRSAKILLPAIVITSTIWIVMWLTNTVFFAGFGFEIPFVGGGLVLILSYIGAIPAVIPGNVGPYYFFNQLGVMSFGISPEDGLAFVILKHAVVVLIPLLASGISLLSSAGMRNYLSTEPRPK